MRDLTISYPAAHLDRLIELSYRAAQLQENLPDRRRDKEIIRGFAAMVADSKYLT